MVLFADEPTGNLDRKNAEDVTNLMVSLRDELKQTLVIVTHDEALADRADRAYRMVDGEMYVRR
jgi:predicted ABC-type transport system involved in lysophospholipase L1 biosynthesis ATPase subunit